MTIDVNKGELRTLMTDLSAQSQNKTASPFAQPSVPSALPVKVHTTYKAMKRIMHAMFLLVFLSLIAVVSVSALNGRDLWQRMPIVDVTNNLAAQYASLVAAPLASNDQVVLEQIKTALLNAPHVVHVQIYNKDGERLLTPNAIPLFQQTPMTDNVITRVNDVVFEQQNVGYLSVAFDIEQAYDYAVASSTHNRKLALIALVLGAIVGAYTMRLFYKLRQQQIQNPS